MAPHGIAITKKDPREIVIDVNSKGVITIARTPITPKELLSVLQKAVREFGDDTPVIVRGDGRASHLMVRQVMDTSAAAGIWKIKIAALKESGG